MGELLTQQQVFPHFTASVHAESYHPNCTIIVKLLTSSLAGEEGMDSSLHQQFTGKTCLMLVYPHVQLHTVWGPVGNFRVDIHHA